MAPKETETEFSTFTAGIKSNPEIVQLLVDGLNLTGLVTTIQTCIDHTGIELKFVAFGEKREMQALKGFAPDLVTVALSLSGYREELVKRYKMAIVDPRFDPNHDRIVDKVHFISDHLM